MSDLTDKDLLAAEFVLGTLDDSERQQVHRQRQQDGELEQLIQAWEARLAPLGDEVKSIAPGPHLLARIERRIDAVEARAALQHSDDRVTRLRRRLTLWRGMAGVSSAAALILAALLVGAPTSSPDQSQFVAVFQQDDQQPAFMLSVNLEQRRLHVMPVTAKPMEDRSYQLWIKEASLGPTPKSVGVLDDDLSIDQSALQQYSPELLKRATFGISVEPSGGSPTGQPTGPAIHGYLYPTQAPGNQRL